MRRSWVAISLSFALPSAGLFACTNTHAVDEATAASTATSATGAGGATSTSSSNASATDSAASGAAQGAGGSAASGTGGASATSTSASSSSGGGGSLPDASVPDVLCSGSYAPPQDVPVAEPALVEASGVAASKQNVDVLWLHNDSGDTARIFAVGTDGAALGELALPGVVAHDFEDIETAACPDGSGPCVWVADLGNNALNRVDLAIYAIAEPAVSKAMPLGQASASKVWTFPVTYPQGVAVDSEALLVAPDGQALWVFEKVDAASARIFGSVGPFQGGTPIALSEVATLASPGIPISKGRMITGADLHPTGERVLVRVYTGVYEYRLAQPLDIAAIAQAQRVDVALGPFSEPQGEAVAYDAAGTGVWTISEDPAASATQPLHHYACVPAP